MSLRPFRARARLLCLSTLLLLAGCAAQTAKPAAPPAAPVGPEHFSQPTAAVEALLMACGSSDIPAAMTALLGAEGAKALVTEGSATPKNCDRFLKAAAETTRLDPWGEDRLVLVVGHDEFPLPVPLVKDAQGWSWDAAAGAKEILRRRIGANELAAIDLCRSVVGKGRAPLQPPSRGYIFHPLTTPGKDAPALIAYPVTYGTTGVMTFVVDRKGVVYQKDLGAMTEATVAAMKTVTLDATWKPTDD